jgi:hypothetical protein
VFRVLLTIAIGIAVFGHSQWGCVVCHSHALPFDALADVTATADGDDDDHEGHSHSGKHEHKHSDHSDGHCFFVLRLPTGSEPHIGAPADSTLQTPITDLVVLAPQTLISTAATLDPSPMLAASRRAQHSVLLL